MSGTAVKETREKLTHRTNQRPEFEHELLAIFAQNELSAAYTLPVYGAVIALAMTSWAPEGVLLCLVRTDLPRQACAGDDEPRVFASATL